MKLFFVVFILSVSVLCLNATDDSPQLTPYPFDKKIGFPEMPVAADNPVSIEGAKLGRYLFYDPILSKDRTISCATCHQQKYAFSDSPNTLSEGIKGRMQTRNTPALFNLAWYPALFWDGRAASLEDQVFFPVKDHAEMNLNWKTAVRRIKADDFYIEQFAIVFGTKNIDSTHIAKAIAQFERTLISADSKFDKVLRRESQLTQIELRGYEIMNDQSMADCLHCHSTDANALATSLKFSNNGLDQIVNVEEFADKGLGGYTKSEKDIGKFKIPSLRNVALTAPYMHDGRFKTLREVIDFYSSGLHNSPTIDSKMTRIKTHGVQLSEYDKICLEAFLMTLTDSSFITNPEFSNPFE